MDLKTIERSNDQYCYIFPVALIMYWLKYSQTPIEQPLIIARLFPRGGGALPKQLGRGVRPASQNPYPIYDQNLRFSLPYLWPDQKFDTLFITWPLNQYLVSDLPYNYFPSSDQC